MCDNAELWGSGARARRPIDLDRLSRVRVRVQRGFKRRKCISPTSKPKEAHPRSFCSSLKSFKKVSSTRKKKHSPCSRKSTVHSRLSVRNPPPKCLHARQPGGSGISAAHSLRCASGAPAGFRGARPRQRQCALRRRRTDFKTGRRRRRSGREGERARERVPAADCTCTRAKSAT